MLKYYFCFDKTIYVYSPCQPVIHVLLFDIPCSQGLKIKFMFGQVNHRKLLDGVFGACGVPCDKFRPICSAVDKLDKSPWSEVRREMIDEKGLDAEVADRIGEYVKLNGKQDMLDALKSDERLKNNEDAQVSSESNPYIIVQGLLLVWFYNGNIS
jgi:histidyl-tRNA synthetase